MIEKIFFDKFTFSKSEFKKFCIVADIGGTKSRFGILGKREKIERVIVHEYDTNEIDKIYVPINNLLEKAKKEYDIETGLLCVGAAGPKEGDYIKLTNAEITIRKDEILRNTLLQEVHLLNDFEMLAYSIDTLEENMIMKINDAKGSGNVKAIIGAGSGLGKSILLFDQKTKHYIPLPTEGGSARFYLEDEEDIKLFKFLRKKEKRIINEEDVVSGRGIENIFEFICEEKYFENDIIREIKKSNNKAELISTYSEKDNICKRTMETFMKYYVRALNNFAIMCLPFAGLYVAGGIVLKNKEQFKKAFNQEFLKFKPEIMKKVPVFLIIDEYAALNGGANYLFNLSDDFFGYL